MNTVIIPVDFSHTSLNAATYAANFLQDQDGISIVLYHCYAKDGEADKATQQLEDLKGKLLSTHALHIDTLAHKEDYFVEGLERAARHRNADLIIMGITPKSSLAQVFYESNALKISRTKACPVLIIPDDAHFTQMKNVMLASDFKDTLNSTPSTPIKNFLSLHRPQLHVVNVDKDHYISLSEKYEREKQQLRSLLQEYNPEFYFMRLFDTTEAIDLFAADRSIDLVIMVQREHSFMEKLFSSHTAKTFTYQSKLPILVIHQ